MIHERIGSEVCIDGIGVLELADPCVLNIFDYEGVTAKFGGLVQIEIVPQIFVDGLGEGADNGSGVVWYCRVDVGPCGRVKHLVLLRFVRSAIG